MPCTVPGESKGHLDRHFSSATDAFDGRPGFEQGVLHEPVRRWIWPTTAPLGLPCFSSTTRRRNRPRRWGDIHISLGVGGGLLADQLSVFLVDVIFAAKCDRRPSSVSQQKIPQRTAPSMPWSGRSCGFSISLRRCPTTWRISSAAIIGSSCAQKRSTTHPESLNSSVVSRSRARLVATLRRQKSTFDAGSR